MNLTQRRWQQEFQEKHIEPFLKELEGICGFAVPVEFNWETMFDAQYGQETHFACWRANYLLPLKGAFEGICSDEMGKTAVREHVKKITVDGAKGTTPDDSSFAGGVFQLNHLPLTNADDLDGKVKTYREIIESKI